MYRLVLLLLLLAAACRRSEGNAAAAPAAPTRPPASEPPLARIRVETDVTVAGLFPYLDALVATYGAQTPYKLTEHVLVRANPWLIDTLESTDYDRQNALGRFLYDQTRCVVLHAGDTLLVPGAQTAERIRQAIDATVIDVNVPAFRLRVLQGDSVLRTVSVRVGKNEKKVLEMARGNLVDLRTQTGEGTVVRANRYPTLYDPVTGKRYHSTRRDDRRVTLLPQIPWLETEINGVRYGQMLHPTTNPATLGKAASNGCIGMREADAWFVYYHAPVGARVRIRYDLLETTPAGDTLRHPDVYRRGVQREEAAAPGGLQARKPENLCVCDPVE